MEDKLYKKTSHLTDNCLNIMRNDKNFFSSIPTGLTRFNQPLNASINKPFKDYLKKNMLVTVLKWMEKILKSKRKNDSIFMQNLVEDLKNKVMNCKKVLYVLESFMIETRIEL